MTENFIFWYSYFAETIFKIHYWLDR